MIDIFTLALTHGLMALAAWRLLGRADLDADGEDAPKSLKPWLAARQELETQEQAGDA